MQKKSRWGLASQLVLQTRAAWQRDCITISCALVKHRAVQDSWLSTWLRKGKMSQHSWLSGSLASAHQSLCCHLRGWKSRATELAWGEEGASMPNRDARLPPLEEQELEGQGQGQPQLPKPLQAALILPDTLQAKKAVQNWGEEGCWLRTHWLLMKISYMDVVSQRGTQKRANIIIWTGELLSTYWRSCSTVAVYCAVPLCPKPND